MNNNLTPVNWNYQKSKTLTFTSTHLKKLAKNVTLLQEFAIT